MPLDRYFAPGGSHPASNLCSPRSVWTGRALQAESFVWTGRALQAESLEWVVGLALLYPALAWSRPLLAIMDIRARSISFSDRPSKASWVTRSRTPVTNHEGRSREVCALQAFTRLSAGNGDKGY